MTLTQYLEPRFREYFPDAAAITVFADKRAETITARIIGPDDGNGAAYIEEYDCEIGSDDNHYEFFTSAGSILTFPLMPEETV